MKKIALFATVASFALAACGSTDDADAPTEPDNVEMPADDVMAQPGMDEDPAVDPALVDETSAESDAGEPTTAPAEDAADAAAAAAADLQAAMDE